MNIRLFSNCINVDGFLRSVIYDLQRNEYDLIPKTLNQLINNKAVSISEIELLEFKKFLTDKDYIMDGELRNFPKLNLQWDYPAKLTNIILDINDYGILKGVQNVLPYSCCQDIQIRFFNKDIDFNKLINFLFRISNSQLKSIELYIPYKCNENASPQCYH